MGLTSDACAYARALDALYAAAQDPALWPQALTASADYVGALGGILVRNPLDGGPAMIVGGRLCDDLNRLYATSYSDNLWCRAVRAAAPAGPVIAGSLVAERDLVRTACYADVIRPQGAIDMAFLNTAPLCQDGAVGGFGFALSRRHADDADGAERRLGRLAPHLHRALALSLRLSEAGAERLALAEALGRLTAGAVVLDGAGRVLLANAAGERMLAAGRSLGVDADRRLRAATAADTARLSEEVRAALDAAEPGRGLLRLRDQGRGGPLTVLVSPLPRPAFALMGHLGAAAVLVLVLGGGEPAGREAAARRAFGLSKAEARVAALVASGMDRPGAAALLGVSVETVKKHLQQCFNKTGTHGQMELARLILQLPPEAARTQAV